MRPDPGWLRREAGGEWFLDRPSLLALAPSLVLVSALVAPSTPVPVLLRLLLAAVVGLVVAAIPIELARAGPFRGRAERPVPLAIVIGFSAGVGVVKAAGTAWAAAGLGVAESALGELAIRASGAAAAGAIVLPAVALLRSALEQLGAERDVLVVEQLQNVLQGGATTPTPVDAEVADLVRTASAELSRSGSGTARRAVAALLEDRVRPLVARLAEDGAGGVGGSRRAPGRWHAGEVRSDIPFRRLVRTALERRPLPVLPVVPGVVLATLGRYATALGPTAAVRAAFGAGAGVTVGLLVPRLLGRRGRGTLAAACSVASAAVLAVVAVGIAVEGDLRAVASVTAADLVVTLVLTGHLAIGTAVIATIRGDRAEVRRELLRLLGPDGLNAAVDRARDRLRRRELAEHLHADLQNRLLASLHRIDRFEGDEAAVLAELTEVQRQLGLAGGLGVAGGSAPMVARLRELAERWRGFLDVTIAVARDVDEGGSGGSCDVDGPRADRVVRVVAEAITNAVRHGHASTIRLDVTVGPDAVRIVAVDDGTGPRSGSPGGGSEHLDVVAVGGAKGWALTADPTGGARLEVLVR